MDENVILTFEHVDYYYQDGSRQVNILKDANYSFEKERLTQLLERVVVVKQHRLF